MRRRVDTEKKKQWKEEEKSREREKEWQRNFSRDGRSQEKWIRCPYGRERERKREREEKREKERERKRKDEQACRTPGNRIARDYDYP